MFSNMEYFVKPGNIVREIWGKSDTILFIFAGAAAEFALNKAVDWLYFTGKLPADPIGRLFSTVSYARKIVFSEKEAAYQAIDKITAIHSSIEAARKSAIPDWAYRDVLFMLIHYSIAAYELLERKLNDKEKDEVYQVFYEMGKRMHLKELPPTYIKWLPVRDAHMQNDLALSNYTTDLFKQYKKHLGSVRFKILIESQKLVVPAIAKKLLKMDGTQWLKPAIPTYKLFRLLHLDGLARAAILPSKYKEEFKALNNPT